jgi:hypothetical protein
MEPGGESTQQVFPLHSVKTKLTNYMIDTSPSRPSLILRPNKRANLAVCYIRFSIYFKRSGVLSRRIKGNEKNTVSELKILSDRNEQREEEPDPNLQGPQTAGSTSNVSGEVDKGMKNCVYMCSDFLLSWRWTLVCVKRTSPKKSNAMLTVYDT